MVSPLFPFPPLLSPQTSKKVMQEVGKQVNLRQRVIATAMVYFHRFYATNNLVEHNPVIMVPTCLFLASKVEETNVKANLLIVALLTVARNPNKNLYIGLLSPSFSLPTFCLLFCLLVRV